MSRHTRKKSRKDTGRSSVQEMKRNGTELSATRLKENETGHPVFKSISALSRGILRMLQGKETIHFNADDSNTEL